MTLRFNARCACLLSIAMLTGCSDPEAPESFGEKTEWSILQAVEIQHRQGALGAPTIEVVSGREVLGVRSRDGKVNVWILLKTEAAPFYKQMPADLNYDLPAELVDKLARGRKLSYTVEHVLRSHQAS